MQGLKQAWGNSLEEVREALESNRIRHRVIAFPTYPTAIPRLLPYPPSKGYFRDSRVEVGDSKDFERLVKVIGKPDNHSTCRLQGQPTKVNRYYASYEIVEGFDPRILDGTIAFKSGKLVERVTIEFEL